MYDPVLDDLLQQIDRATIQLADLNSSKGPRGSVRMRQGLIAQLTGLNTQIHLRYQELYPTPVPWSTSIVISWYMKAAAFAVSVTMMTVIVGVFVLPWFQSFTESLLYMAHPVP